MMRRGPSQSPDRLRLEQALQAAGLGDFEWDLERDQFLVSPCLAAMTGLSVGRSDARRGAALDAHILAEDVAGAQQARTAALEGRSPTFRAEYRLVRPDDGRTVWLKLTGAIARRPDGRAVTVTGVVEEISTRKVEEDQRITLMAELDHRVKNVLAAVQALAQQTAKRTTSLDGFLQTFAGRLKAMGSANELLTAARWRGAAVDHLAAAELGALAPHQTRWEGPELFLTPRAANAVSLALHELATNAVKYGALSTETGRVDVAWRGHADGGFELTWTESGGPMVAPSERRGFGSTLLGQVTGRELNGEAYVDFRPGGVFVRLRAGAPAVAPRPETAPHAPLPRVIEPAPAPPGGRDLSGVRVLIVEDAVLLALELETGLSDAGASIVGPAYELEEAMALLDQPIDVAVLDANLNGRSVIPVAEALQARGVPFVFATGYGEVGGPGDFDAPVIRKPYDVTQVAAAVAALLGRT